MFHQLDFARQTILQHRTLCTREALAAVVDIHVYRTDITFDRFRIQDAELYRQGGVIAQKHKGIWVRIFRGLLWDTIFAGLFSMV